MAKKIALLIGVSEYADGIPPMSSALNDVEAMGRVLQNPNLGNFAQVERLLNPDVIAMKIAIQKLFRNADKEDLLLLFFSGHGIIDDDNHLYLATHNTAKDYFEATAINADFIQIQSNHCYCQRQVLILDACYSGAFANGWHTKSIGVDIKKQLGAQGRIVLTSANATQTSFAQEGATLSLYTQYLVEGIETGAAQKDGDGNIHVRELHAYAKAKVQAVKPNITPDIIMEEGYNIVLAYAAKNLEAEYRQLVEQYTQNGELNEFAFLVLTPKRQTLGITDAKAEEIETEVLEAVHKRLANLQNYKQAFAKAVEQKYPLDEYTSRILKDYQQDILGLKDEDVKSIKLEIISAKKVEDQKHLQIPKQSEKEEYENNLVRYRQELTKVVQVQYPLDEYVRNGLKQFQQFLRIRNEDVVAIELEITSVKEAEYQKQLQIQKQQELEALQRQRELQAARGLGLHKCELKTFDFETAKINNIGTRINRIPKSAEFFAEDLGKDINLEMVSIPGGIFVMGSHESEPIRRSYESPQHKVTVAPFFMGKYPVTQKQWSIVAGLPQVNIDLRLHPSSFPGDNLPVACVSWDDAQEFCARLTKKTKKAYRLPSEAEWEYACRGGTNTPFYFGETISTDLANYDGNYTYDDGLKGEYRKQTTEVGKFPANPWGLYDMCGNVWEWCQDEWHENYINAPTSSSAWLDNMNNYIRLLRGGSWYAFPASTCRSAYRNHYNSDNRSKDIGFRVACSGAMTNE
jgi:formylglycine-generating enzyme required for sulfatase activity